MKVLDETGMGVFWALVKEYIANHVEEVTNNYLPLTGGTLSGDVRLTPNNTLSIARSEEGVSVDVVKLGWVSASEKGDGIFIRSVSDGSNHLSINYKGIRNDTASEDYFYTTDGNYRTLKTINDESLFDGGNLDLDARYIPISGGTMTGGLNINNYAGLTTMGRVTTSSGLKTTTWTSWMMRNGGYDDEIAAIWYVENDAIRLVRINPDDMDLSDPPVLFTPFRYDTNNAIWLCNSKMYISQEGIFHTRQLVSDNRDPISGYGSLELYAAKPFIDFHYDGSQEDYTSRIIENESGTLTVSKNLSVNGRTTATEFYENSDVTLKENVDSVSESDVEKINKVEFKEFNFIDDEDKTKKYGVIAQEVEEAGLDNLVSTNAEGKKAVDYISLLVLKIQALEKRVAELEAERR